MIPANTVKDENVDNDCNTEIAEKQPNYLNVECDRNLNIRCVCTDYEVILMFRL